MDNFSTDITYLKSLELFPMQNQVDDFLSFPRPYHILSFIAEGNVIFKTGDVNIKLSAGDIVFIPQGTTYSSVWSGNIIHCISLFFSVKSNSTKFCNKKFPLQKIENCEHLLEHFVYINEKREQSPFLSIGRFYELLEKISEHLSYTDVPQIDARIKVAVDYIDNHYVSDFGIEELAKLSHMSTPNFYRCFKRDTGVSPLKYKNNALITAAIMLLSNNHNMSIEEISIKLGFKSAAYFRRLFKETVGKTPSEYRKTEFNATPSHHSASKTPDCLKSNSIAE